MFLRLATRCSSTVLATLVSTSSKNEIMSSPAQLDVYIGSVVLISYFWYRTSLIRMTGKEKRTELDLCLKKYPTRERSLKNPITNIVFATA